MKIVKKTCPFCNKENEIKMTDEQYKKYVSGDELIQNIFPNLSAGEREILITGICDNCWNTYL